MNLASLVSKLCLSLLLVVSMNSLDSFNAVLRDDRSFYTVKENIRSSSLFVS